MRTPLMHVLMFRLHHTNQQTHMNMIIIIMKQQYQEHTIDFLFIACALCQSPSPFCLLYCNMTAILLSNCMNVCVRVCVLLLFLCFVNGCQILAACMFVCIFTSSFSYTHSPRSGYPSRFSEWLYSSHRFLNGFCSATPLTILLHLVSSLSLTFYLSVVFPMLVPEQYAYTYTSARTRSPV